MSRALGAWPKDVLRATLAAGEVVTGQIVEREPVPGKPGQYRVKLKVANRDLYGADFRWIDEGQIARREYPAQLAVIDRTEWGALIGTLQEVRDSGRVVATGPVAALAELQKRLPEAARVRREIRAIEKGTIGRINHSQEQVRLAGFRDDLDRVLPCLDLVVHPAEMEGLGVSLLQAAAAGVPLIGTAVGGIPEVVRHEESGLLIPPADEAALAEAVIALLRNPERARALGRAGRALVEREFSVASMVKGNMAVYRALLAQAQDG